MNKLEELTEWKRRTASMGAESWAEDVKAESLNVKFDRQLSQMETTAVAHRVEVGASLERLNKFPGEEKARLFDQAKQMGMDPAGLDAWVDAEFDALVNSMVWRSEKLDQSITRIRKEKELRAGGLDRSNELLGTTYYCDSDNGSDSNAGTHPTTSPWKTMEKFAENTRAAGDVCICRRGRTATYNLASADMNILTSGTSAEPIRLEADYDDVWGDFANSDQTYSPVFGSKTMEASATITGVSAGDWVYVTGDDNRRFSYEVASVSGTTLTLYLPFKGTPGSGVTLVVMPPSPLWGTAASNYSFDVNSPKFWIIQGINIQSQDTAKAVYIRATDVIFRDCCIDKEGQQQFVVTYGTTTDDTWEKCRIHNFAYYAFNLNGGKTTIRDSLIEGTDKTNALVRGISIGTHQELTVEDSEIKETYYPIIFIVSTQFDRMNLRGMTFTDYTASLAVTTQYGSFWTRNKLYTEHEDGTFGKSTTQWLQINNQPQVETDTAEARAGGSAFALLVTPTNRTGAFPVAGLMDLTPEKVPVYFDDTSEVTWDFYAKPTATSAWTADPTDAEFYVEVEYPGESSGHLMRKTRGTCSADFNGTATYHVALSVTFTPARAGIGYFSLRYGKLLESGKANTFYIDPAPVAS